MKMNKIAARVWELARTPAQELGLEIWDVAYGKEAGQWVLRIYIDRDGGVGLDDCEALSRAMDPILDAEDPVPDSYVFEVSSPGAERILKRPLDFQRFLGHRVEVRLYRPIDGGKVHFGELDAYADGDVTIRKGTDLCVYPAEAVAQVRLSIV